MTDLERASWEAVRAAEAGDLDRLAAALEARQAAMQRACIDDTSDSGAWSGSKPASEADPPQTTQETRRAGSAKPGGRPHNNAGRDGETITPEVFALGEQALAQLREIAASIREQQARLDTIQSGFTLDVALEPRLDFRG